MWACRESGGRVEGKREGVGGAVSKKRGGRIARELGCSCRELISRAYSTCVDVDKGGRDVGFGGSGGETARGLRFAPPTRRARGTGPGGAIKQEPPSLLAPSLATRNRHPLFCPRVASSSWVPFDRAREQRRQITHQTDLSLSLAVRPRARAPLQETKNPQCTCYVPARAPLLRRRRAAGALLGTPTSFAAAPRRRRQRRRRPRRPQRRSPTRPKPPP